MKDETGKDQGERHPDAAPDPRFSVFDCVSFAVEEPEIKAQHGNDEDTKSYPQPI